MKIECEVARDLIPLYIEGLTSEGSNEFLLNHIKDCSECKEVFDELQKDISDNKINKTYDIKDIPANRLIKKIRNRILSFVVIALFMGVFLNTFGSNALKICKARAAATNFLDSVSIGDFDQAFDYVAYFDFASDMEPNISYEEAKIVWVSRISALKSKGTYVKAYSRLKVWTDDTYPNGEVILTIVEKGVERKHRAYIHFAPFSKGWRVQNIYPRNGEDQSEIEKALYGYINIVN